MQALALQLRSELLEMALQAKGALGPPPPYLTQIECDVRVWGHDLTHRDHDKDYRMYAAFPPDLLKTK